MVRFRGTAEAGAEYGRAASACQGMKSYTSFMFREEHATADLPPAGSQAGS